MYRFFIPLSCVAGPGLTHGNKPGHKYAYSSSFLPTIPKPKLSKGAALPVGAPWTLPNNFEQKQLIGAINLIEIYPAFKLPGS